MAFPNIIHIIIICSIVALLRCRCSSQVLTIQERWRFESIPNQLVKYSPHKPHFPRRGRLGHRSQYSGTVVGSTETFVPRGRPAANRSHDHLKDSLFMPPWSPIHLQYENDPAGRLPTRTELLGFAVSIIPTNCGACVQNDSRNDTTDGP